MKDIFEFYLNACQQAMIHETELSFEFGDYFVIFSFEKRNYNIEDDELDEDFYSYNGISTISEIDELLIKITRFSSFIIKGYEYLGWREDLIEGRSISNEMYALVKKINSYRKESVQNFFADVEYGDGMCDTDGNYTFTVQVVQDLWWDIKFAKYLISSFESVNSFLVPSFYTVFFNRNASLKDIKSVPIVSSNTKVRRIGYFKVLALFLKEFKKVPSTTINKKFENFCLKYKKVIEDSKFRKGVVSETKSGISAKPYIDVAGELSILNKINSIFVASKSFKVYQVLQSELSDTEHVFDLSAFDKIFFLECILRNDYFYFTNLLELIFIDEETTYSDLILKFQDKLIRCLEEYKKTNSLESRKVLQNFELITNRIKKWEKPKVYLEHIIMPRLNWMLDFGIIKEKGQNEFEITEAGIKLFSHLAVWNDLNTGRIMSPNSFLDRFIIHVYDDCYNSSSFNNPPDLSLILGKMYHYIEDSFKLFKTLAPNRVTASQAVNYAKYKLYFVENIKVGYQFILNNLSENKQDKFIFKYQEHYQDGYIQIKN